MKFKETEVFNFKGALRGMRNPLESWDRSDSFPLTYDGKNANLYQGTIVGYHIGEKDLELAQRLILAGKEHAKFMRQIFVTVDITAPLYWWKEADTYKIGTTANSTSTMHKITSTPIKLECFEVDDYCGTLEVFDSEPYNPNTTVQDCLEDTIIPMLESLRRRYIETKNIRYWKELIRWLPSSWLQTRTITLNYAVLREMYFQRRNHKLTEWSVDFINWLLTLPYAKELICIEKERTNG